MILKKRGFTLLELQMASVLMIVVLIATGVIFYFALASIRYIHDAAMVYSNASSAMKTLTREIMVSNCWGNGQGVGFATPRFSFFGVDGYIHGISTDGVTIPGGMELSGQEVGNANGQMPTYGAGAGDLFLRQVAQEGNPAVAGDFPAHSIVRIFRQNIGVLDELAVDVDNPARQYVVAHHITDFTFQPIAYNCVAVQVTATGDVLDPIGQNVYQVTLGKMITLRCAPTYKPWLNIGQL